MKKWFFSTRGVYNSFVITMSALMIGSVCTIIHFSILSTFENMNCKINSKMKSKRLYVCVVLCVLTGGPTIKNTRLKKLIQMRAITIPCLLGWAHLVMGKGFKPFDHKRGSGSIPPSQRKRIFTNFFFVEQTLQQLFVWISSNNILFVLSSF